MQVSFEPGTGWSATPDIPYRGSRDYINGADLYAASSAIVAAAIPAHIVTAFDVRYPRFTRNAGTFRLSEAHIDRAKLAGSSVRIQAITSDGQVLTGWYEETDRQPGGRTENHEATIVAAIKVEGNIARYIGDPGPPVIEIIVYVTRTLLQSLHPPGSAKWIFTAMRSDGLLADTQGDVEIGFDHAIGSRAVSCTVTIGRQKFGYIYFGKSEI